MFGRKREGAASRLESLAAKAQGIVSALEPTARDEAIAGIGRIIEGTRALGVLPDELVNTLWQAVIVFVLKLQTGAKPAALLEQLIKGAPMLEPYAGSLRREIG